MPQSRKTSSHLSTAFFFFLFFPIRLIDFDFQETLHIIFGGEQVDHFFPGRFLFQIEFLILRAQLGVLLLQFFDRRQLLLVK